MSKHKCAVVLSTTSPEKVAAGWYLPEYSVGAYGFRMKKSFGIPEGVKPVSYIRRGFSVVPLFFVDARYGLAMSHLGQKPIVVTEDLLTKLAAKLEVCTQVQYVKSMVLRVFDLVQTLIIGAAGLGVGLFVLHLISTFTGNAITI